MYTDAIEAFTVGLVHDENNEALKQSKQAAIVEQTKTQKLPNASGKFFLKALEHTNPPNLFAFLFLHGSRRVKIGHRSQLSQNGVWMTPNGLQRGQNVVKKKGGDNLQQNALNGFQVA